MFKLTVLGSGSAGNCALLETEHSRVLLDGGLSARQMALRVRECGVEPEQIDGIVLTHEHFDHAGGLGVWCRQYHTPIYCNRLTAEALSREEGAGCRDWRKFVTGTDFTIGDIAVQSFAVPHDAVEPVGFVFHHAGARVGLLTDLGIATRAALERVKGVGALIIETNHDEKLLQNDTRRPWSVKQRIMSRHGHLSNAAAAEVIVQLLEGGLRQVVLGHLSRDCNTPELAIGTVRSRVTEAGGQSGVAEVEVYCASQREIGPKLCVEAAQPVVRVEETPRVNEQMSFLDGW